MTAEHLVYALESWWIFNGLLIYWVILMGVADAVRDSVLNSDDETTYNGFLPPRAK